MRTKKKKYEALSSMTNMYQISSWIDNIYIQSMNEQIYIKSENIADIYTKITSGANKVILEICCGAGDYTVGMARLDNSGDSMYIWVDIKGDRLYKWANIAIEEWLVNVAWIRGDIRQLTQVLWFAGIDEIWITFPDPQLWDNNEHNRVTSPKFLSIYSKLLKPNGFLCIKTDDAEFADYTICKLHDNDDFVISIHIDDVVWFLENSEWSEYQKIITNKSENSSNIKNLLQITTWYESRRRQMDKKIQFISALR